MSLTFAYHTTHVEQIESIAGFNGRRNIADKSFEGSPFSEDAEKNIAAIDLRETPGRKLDISVSRGLSQSANRNHVTGTRLFIRFNSANPFFRVQRRCRRSDLVYLNKKHF